MNKYLALLLATSITGAMAADDKEYQPEGKETSSLRLTKRTASIDQDARLAAVAKTERQKKLDFLTSTILPELKEMGETTNDSSLNVLYKLACVMQEFATAHKDPMLQESVKKDYVNFGKEIPAILYADEIDQLVSAEEEVREVKYGHGTPGKTLSMTSVSAYSRKVQYSGRVTDVGISLSTLRVLTKHPNVIAVRKDCMTLLDEATKGLPAQDWVYEIYMIPSDIKYLMKKFPSILERNFKTFIEDALNLYPLRYAEANDTIGNIQKMDECLSILGDEPTIAPELAEKYNASYNNPFGMEDIYKYVTKVQLRARWHPKKEETTANAMFFEDNFYANMKDLAAAFNLESKIKKPKKPKKANAKKASSSNEKTEKPKKTKKNKSEN